LSFKITGEVDFMPILTYHNDINKISAKTLNEKELNLLFALIYKFRKERQLTLTINFLELKTLSNGDVHSHRFISTIENTYKKILQTKQQLTLPNGDLVLFNVFNEFIISYERKEITVEINKRFRYLIDNLVGNYTKFDLIEFIHIRSSYSKNMFRLLKQFETTKTFIITMEKFRDFFTIPISYTMSKINDKVLKIIIKDLKPLFKNLKIEKLKKGKFIEKLKFTWASNIQYRTSKCESKVNTHNPSRKIKNSQIRPSLSDFELAKQKLYPKLIKFISDFENFTKLNNLLHQVTTPKELDNFKLKYNLG
jgi:plasmid replication initiation protein